MSPKTRYQRPHHQSIHSLLELFNAEYLSENNILFGNGTRIVLELNEYRESIDIDFLCADPTSYRAVRSEVTTHSLGCLMTCDSSQYLAREVRADRDAVRTFIKSPMDELTIKLEFVHFDYYDLSPQHERLLPVPCLDHNSCYLTKLLSNADRWAEPNKKDIIDLLVMHHHWGDIPNAVLKKADEKYGYSVVYDAIIHAADAMTNHYHSFFDRMSKNLKMDMRFSKEVLDICLPAFLKSLPHRI